MAKEVRFSQLVAASGKPETMTLCPFQLAGAQLESRVTVIHKA